MIVRPAGGHDAAAVAAVYAPYVLGSAATFESEPPDEAEVLRRMSATPRLPWLVAERDGDVVGYACASHHRVRPAYRWAVDVSVYLAADERGRGTGRALYDVLLPVVRELGYVTAHAAITLPNAGSVRLHESCGFAAVGVYRSVGYKLGAWRDVGWWQLHLVDPPAAPDEPRPWAP